MAGGGVLRRLTHPAFAAAGARVITLPVSIGCGLVGARLTIVTLGPTLFGVVSLVLTLQMAFNLLDLGTSAAVLNEAARTRVQGDNSSLLRTWASARRIAQQACLAVLALTIGLAALNAWPVVLGVVDVSEVSLAVTVVALINVVARPSLLALAALQGFGHSVTVVLLQVSVPIVSLIVVVVGAVLHAPLTVFAASLASGQLVCGLAALAMVSRRYGLPLRYVRSHGARKANPEVRRQAGPMLVISLVAPLGMGLDRVALAHMATPLALATYALISQLLQPVFTLSATLMQTFWGEFSRNRHEGTVDWASLGGPLGLIAPIALISGVGFAVATPWVAHLLAGDEIPVGHGVSSLAGAVVLLTLLETVPGALLTSPAGLSAQAKVLVATVFLNLAVTWALASYWGAAAALAGSVLGLAVQCVILAELSRRYIRDSNAKGAWR
jgi:O-antigen/teichoic acid export membrane protein